MIEIKEEWKEIKGFNNYHISNLGRVYSNKRKKFLHPSKNTWGYFGVMLYDNNGIRKRMPIHRLVATHFIKNEKNKNEVNHIDGNKENNSVTNLEWCTRRENMIHAYKLGLEISPMKGKFGLENKRSKQVLQFDNKGRLIAFYDSELLASREIKEKYDIKGTIDTIGKNISKYCNGSRVTAYGFAWRFVDDSKIYY